MKNITLLIIILIYMTSQTAYALDDNRKGVIFGPGAGIQITNLDYSFNGSNYSSKSKSGLAISAKVGAGITNQFALYFVKNISWFVHPRTTGASSNDTIYHIDISGVGASYYFSPTAPSGYLLGAVGVGTHAYRENDEDKSDTGIGFMFGGGYEIRKHLHLEGTLLSTNTDDSDDSRYNLKATSLQFTLNYLWY